ncbi:P-loop NTPase fold protein [Alicyclobacillus dauci]|uniref:KAP family NTPase n=1 Tax=Alicyclobacillus dauci TaxID=1475485 RepID=A0ABY6Z595_9BACL|nr:P-loop NTPase fold protein [Alicyclobacillus dauci]WAH37454.1 KAP family NTPase [Alicyclobacillus dauci]
MTFVSCEVRFMFSGSKYTMTNMFIADEPVKSSGEDEFQLAHVSQLVLEALRQENPPSYVALLGPWGSGKSSVLQMLNADVAKGDYCMEFVNVWKFADDAPSLHRKIVREVQHVLGIHDDSWNEEHTYTGTLSGSGLWSMIQLKLSSWEKRFSLFSWLAILLTLACATVAVYAQSPLPLYVTVVLWFVLTKSTIQRSSQFSIKKPASSHRDQYEEQFKNAVTSYLNPHKGKRLILVFDDLDRLPSDQLMAALNTIRTYLQSERCVFIVPCDEQILRDAALKTLSLQINPTDTKGEADSVLQVSEFISKTFDLIVRLPVLEQSNMKQYAKRLLQTKTVSWTRDVRINMDRLLSVLIHSNVKTPRHVKLLINAFGADWALAQKRDDAGGSIVLTKNAIVLAVFSVLKADFPQQYKELSKTPFDTIKSLKDRNGSDPNLNAYISRVIDYLPDDPRPYLYFSNVSLNPLTGRPNVQKVKDFLINGQSTEFIEGFADLNGEDRALVMTIVLDELEINPGLETENCLSVLVDHPGVMSHVNEMSRMSWEVVIRENARYLVKHRTTNVSRVLRELKASDVTWTTIGAQFSVEEVFKEQRTEILNLWLDDDQAVLMLGIPHVATRLSQAFFDDADGHTFVKTFLNVPGGNSLTTAVDWWNCLLELAEGYICEFDVVSWLRKWDSVEGNGLKCSQINKFLEVQGFEDVTAFEGIGDLWCEVYDGSEAAIQELFKLIPTDGFSGFTEKNLEVIGAFSEQFNQDDKFTLDMVKCLQKLWSTDEDRCIAILPVWGKTRAASVFASSLVEQNLETVRMQAVVDVLTEGASGVDTKEKVLQVLSADLLVARGQNTIANKASYLLQLVVEPEWNKAATAHFSEWFPVERPEEWMRWSEVVVRMTTSLYSATTPMDDQYQQWLSESISCMALVHRGLKNYGLPFQNQASWYLQILFELLVKKPELVDWESSVPLWQRDGVFEVLNQSILQAILIVVARRCSLGNEDANSVILQHGSYEHDDHVHAMIERFRQTNSQGRIALMTRLANQQESVQNAFVNRLHSTGALGLEHIDEFSQWPIDIKLRKLMCDGVTDTAPRLKIRDWISSRLDDLLEREDFWVSSVCIRAWGSRSDYPFIPNNVSVRRLLETGDERAEAVMKLMIRAKISRPQVREFRDNIEQLLARYPETAGELKKIGRFRFAQRGHGEKKIQVDVGS